MLLKTIWRSALWLVALKSRIEEAFVPLASPSCELATLAFFAVFNVLIKDFFWIDILGSLLFKFLSFLQTQYLYATGVPDRSRGLREPSKNSKSITYRELRRTLPYGGG